MPKLKSKAPTFGQVLDGLPDVIAYIIRKYAAAKGYRWDYQVAGQIGMNVKTFQRKLHDGGWKDRELAEIIHVLEIPADDVAKMLGGKTV